MGVRRGAFRVAAAILLTAVLTPAAGARDHAVRRALATTFTVSTTERKALRTLFLFK